MSTVAVPSPPPTAAPRGGLPVPLTELVGREADLDGVRSLLRGHRVVTLVGPGGVGKTRLAVAAASEETGTSESVRFVELAGAEPPSSEGPGISAADLAVLVASAVGLRDEAVRGATAPEHRDRSVERLGAALGERRLLIVLDNCEHVIDQAAELVERLLAGTPAVRVLATSREPLGVAGEAVWAVAPLEVPRVDTSDPAGLRRSAAARLFLARAAEAAPGFSPTDRDTASVAAICRRLDGLPLALELAASRIRAFGVRALAERLDDRFRMLSAGRRGAPPRQRTLRAVIDWSWELLDEAERTVLRRLAVHREGCTMEAAETVCSGGGVAAADVAALVARLVDRSLVVPYRTGETRYGLLESVAVYCLERLEEAGESARLRHRHRIYYRDFAERADPLLRGPGQREWLARLDAEAANLRAAVETAVRDGEAESARRITTALVWYWYLRGRRYEAARSLARALAVPGPVAGALEARARSGHAAMVMFSGRKRAETNGAALAPFDGSEDPAGRAMAQWLLAHAEFGFGDLAESERLLDEALAAFQRIGDHWGTAAALGIRASQAIFRGDLAAVRRHGRRSAELFTELGDDWGRLLAIGAVGTYHELTGDYPKSAECYLEGRRIAEDLELWPDLSTMLARHGRVAILEGDHAQAGVLLEGARRIAVEHADRPGEEFADVGLALSERRQGRLEAAEARLRRWLEWNRRVEADYGSALLYAELGFIAELREDAAAAEELHRSGLAAARATGDPRAVALALEGLAGVRSLTGRHVRAARLLRSAGELRASSGAALPAGERGDVERIAARVRAALGEAALHAEPREAGLD